MQARSGALDELLESGVLEDVGGGNDDIQKELDQVGSDAQVDNELAALKAQLGTGAARARRPLRTCDRRPGVLRGAPVLLAVRRRLTDEAGDHVGELHGPVFLQEVAGARDRGRGRRPRAPGTWRWSTSAQPAVAASPSENAVRKGTSEAREHVDASGGSAGRRRSRA